MRYILVCQGFSNRRIAELLHSLFTDGFNEMLEGSVSDLPSRLCQEGSNIPSTFQAQRQPVYLIHPLL